MMDHTFLIGFTSGNCTD